MFTSFTDNKKALVKAQLSKMIKAEGEDSIDTLNPVTRFTYDRLMESFNLNMAGRECKGDDREEVLEALLSLILYDF